MSPKPVFRLAFLSFLLLPAFVAASSLSTAIDAHARQSDEDPSREGYVASDATPISLDTDRSSTTSHEVEVNGAVIPYTTTVGMQPVYSDDGKPIAALFYTYYGRSDIENTDSRPLFISFNGGPGSGSLWMHLGYTSPKVLKIDEEGYPVQPYGVRDNPHSIIDVADIVYVNPVNTGFSRIIGDADRDQFFGVNEDAEYLADWIDTFVSRQGRWTSPKYLIGESYGTTRVSALAGQLQNSHWMYLNGIILVSPTGLGLEPPAMQARSEILKLPYYTAAAWYHEQLPTTLQTRDLPDVLAEVEAFTIDEFLPAVARGGFIEDDERRDLADRIARYSGLDPEFVLNHNLAVPASAFWKELLRDEGGYTIGRLDSRYRGVDEKNAGDSYDYPAELTSWNHAFAPAINHYLRDVLGYETDLQYNLFGPVHPWNRDGNQAGESLRQAMAQNPFLHVMIQSGYFDGATDYFSAKYTMWNLDRSGRLSDRLRFEGYRSGHMMYLRAEDLKLSNQHIRDFIQASTPADGQPARY